MIELGTVWERRMNAPGYLPHFIRIDKTLDKPVHIRGRSSTHRVLVSSGSETYILTFVELAKYYTRDLAVPAEPVPEKEYVEKARELLALQAAKPIINSSRRAMLRQFRKSCIFATQI